MSSAPHPDILLRVFARPYVGDLRVILKNEFMDSFNDFTTSWRENCVFTFSPTVANTIREKLSLFNGEDFVAFIEWILGYVGSDFLPFQFAALLQVDFADDEFFDIVLAVMEYLKDAFETIANILNVNTGTQEYQNKFGSVEPVTYLVEKSSEMFFSHYGDRIMKTICKRVRFLRKGHAYHDSAFWNSVSNTSLAKIAEVLNQVPETERYGEFVKQYESELVDDVREYVKKIPLTVSEKHFLLKMRECVDVEETVYNTLVSPDVEVYDDCNTKVLDLFRDEHERRRDITIFKNMDSELVNPDAKFSAAYFRDIYALYIFRGDQTLTESLQKLSSIIQESFVQIVLTHVNRLGEAEQGQQSLESFTLALQELSKQNKLIKTRLSQISDSEALMKALDTASSQLSLSRLSSMGYEHQMRAAEEYIIRFLCNRNIRSNDELESLTLMVNYFLSIPQRARFMNELYLKMRTTAIQRVQLPMDRLNIFTSSRHLNGIVSKRVECLIQDLNASLGMGGHDFTTFHDASSGLKCDTCLVTRSRYWGSNTDQSKLLRSLPAISRIQERVAAHLEQNIDKDRRLIAMHSMSRVVLKTTLYTRGRNFTRLDMLQHQSMILMLCAKTERVRMSDIVRSLSTERFETEIERKRAEKLIGFLVQSLMRPYPLLEMTQNIASDPDNPIISINHTFAFHEDNVRLPGDLLLLNEEICF